MKREIIVFIKKHLILYKTAKIVYAIWRFIKYTLGHFRCAAQRIFRKVSNKKYNPLCLLKNKHKGKRCFIICTGPSLSIADLEKLKNEYTFGMNNIFRLFDRTSWRPTYYGVIDPSVYKKLCTDNAFAELKNVFIPDLFVKQFENISLRQYNVFPMDYYELYWSRLTKKPVRFSSDISTLVYDVATVTYSLMQIAVYMGFEEIYLLGSDCDYSGSKQHFEEYGITVINNPEKDIMVAHTAARDYAEKHNIKIYNATRGGKLEIYPRVDFDSLFDDSENPNY